MYGKSSSGEQTYGRADRLEIDQCPSHVQPSPECVYFACPQPSSSRLVGEKAPVLSSSWNVLACSVGLWWLESIFINEILCHSAGDRWNISNYVPLQGKMLSPSIWCSSECSAPKKDIIALEFAFTMARARPIAIFVALALVLRHAHEHARTWTIAQL